MIKGRLIDDLCVYILFALKMGKKYKTEIVAENRYSRSNGIRYLNG